MSVSGAFEISSAVSQAGDPLVMIKWGSMSGHLTPDQAHEHALSVIAVAETAITEATLLLWAQQHFGLTMTEAANSLAEFRATFDDQGAS